VSLDFAVWQGESLLLAVYAQPGARQSEFAGMQGEALKIRLKAPALEGRANKELCRFVAEAFGVAAGQVELLRGAGSRHKRLCIHGPRRVPEALAALLPQHT
jgi:uncharacterized protein (TIGR00251 family)